MFNKIANRLTAWAGVACMWLATIWVRFTWQLRDVKLGSGLMFYGIPFCTRIPGSVIKIGNNCRFRSSPRSNLIGVNRRCIIATHTSHAVLEIGSGSGFSGTVIGCFLEIKIGSNVKVGSNSTITDSDWHSEDKRSGNPAPVKIGNNVWIGIETIILKGVTIGENSVIGAGSVVTGDIPPNVIAAGNPCRVIRQL